MVRASTFTAPLLFAAACAAGSSPTPPPGGPGDPAGPSQPTPTQQTATTLGMTILSADANGAPRLMRAISPRASAAGMAPEDAARDHVTALAPLWLKQARPMALANNGTQRLRNGATVVKLQQEVDGVRVHGGELRVLMNPNGSLAAVSGTLLPSAAKPTFVSSPTRALERALDHLYGKQRPRPAITEGADRAGWRDLTVAAAPEFTITKTRARRELATVNGKLVPAWAIEVFGPAAPDPLRDSSMRVPTGHRYVITDAGGVVVSDANLIKQDAFVYRAYAETTGNRRPLDGPLQSFAPHPTGTPDGSEPGFVNANLVVMDSFNGPLDPWLPSNATTTSGNNVDAFSDFDASETFSDGDIRPAVRSGRVLNYRIDPTAEPLSSLDQIHAGTVNSFFVTNWLHDWYYDSGFTEATGNAQVNNYGRGGVEGDPLVVLAQNGAAIGDRNNAFMGTPADGGSPHMLMLLWTSGTESSLTTPTSVVRTESFAAGPQVFDLTGEVAVINDGVDPGNDGCQPSTVDLTGKIALVTFSGVCGSLATVNGAKAAGAIGIILADGALDDPRSFAGSAAANIPGLAIGKTDGEALAAAVAAGPVTVTLHSAPTGPERDGDLDNTIVAHEWGHYLHHRLAVCDSGQQCGGMSEGWGDFNALLMMLRDGDNRDGTYAMAPYAVADGTPNAAYFGLRRFPYSIDRTKNALSFRHITAGQPLPTETPGFPGGDNFETHNEGEVWASMLWETYNVLIDAHGVTTARRRMTDYVVAGLLLTPAEATFTEGRDAILAAASALDTDDMILMAAAFAGRGAGTCAIAPGNDTPTNEGLVESGTLAARIDVSSISLTDDGVSCDNDGVLDPGESGQLRVTLVNAGIIDAEGVSITATTSSPGVRLGAPIRIPSLHPFVSTDLAIPVTLLASAPRNAPITINVVAAGDGVCAPGSTTVALSQLTGIDEVPATSNVDHVETNLTPWTPAGLAADSLWGRASLGSNHVWFGANAGFPTDTQLVSPALEVGAGPFVVTISHAYDFEADPTALYDGGVIEVSSDGGATWSDVADHGIDPGYTGELFSGFGNVLGGRAGFGATSPGFPDLAPLTLDFGTQFAGQSVLLRFRIATDAAAAFTGWLIDDITVTGTTNTPFPTRVAEPSTCTARKAVDDSRVVAIRTAPTASLDPHDAAVCIAGDTP